MARKRNHNLDTLAKFQRRRPIDDYGPETDPWETVFHEWIGYRPLSGMSRIVAQQVEEGQTGIVTMHFREDVDATLRIVDDKGRVMEIKGEPSDVDDAGEFLELDVSVVTGRQAVT